MLDVVREFTYPVGLGTFNPYTYPPRAIITTVTRVGDSIAIAADVEMAVKAQRDHMIVRTALKRDTLRDTYPINADARYVLVSADGKVAAAGVASRQADGRFVAPLPAGLPSGHTRLRRRCFSMETHLPRISGVSPSARTELGGQVDELRRIGGNRGRGMMRGRVGAS